MISKKKIGALVILAGISILGYVYFKKNKPKIATIQKKSLEDLSNFYKSGGVKEDTKLDDVSVVAQQPITIDPFSSGSLFLDSSFADQLKQAQNESRENMALYGTPYNPNKPIDTTMFPQLANVGAFTLNKDAVSNIANMDLGWGGLNFDKIKINI